MSNAAPAVLRCSRRTRASGLSLAHRSLLSVASCRQRTAACLLGSLPSRLTTSQSAIVSPFQPRRFAHHSKHPGTQKPRDAVKRAPTPLPSSRRPDYGVGAPSPSPAPTPRRPSSSSSANRPNEPDPFAPRSSHSDERQSGKRQSILGFVPKPLLVLAVIAPAGYVLFDSAPPVQHVTLAVERSIRVGIAVAECILDYKALFRKTWAEETEEGKMQRHQDYSDTHRRCAERILEVLKKNGGIYIKLGQHLSSVQLIPQEWSSTMRPLQDQCTPTPLEDLGAMFEADCGGTIDEIFSSFDPKPIGVASLAQVHIATERASGRKVAVKVMHPSLEEFARVDMDTVSVMLDFVKYVFPTFEFTWLGEEMQQNLPLEMDFCHEAANAARCAKNFEHLRHTTLVIPEVLWAKKRVLVMEYIEGARVDDLEYLKAHHMDRNRIAQELSRIFSHMLYLDGFFHADPHLGNLLIRPRQPGSRSQYNFEIVLLDHGLYFDIDRELRTNYARLWLSLLRPKTKQVDEERRKYAKLVGNIGDDLYPIFETAITGRAGFEDEKSGGSLMDLAEQSPEEQHRIRTAVVEEGLVGQIFELLRRVPRRLLMVLKLNDLTRALDASLNTTHSPLRIWLILSQFCNRAVYDDEIDKLWSTPRPSGIWSTLSLYASAFNRWWSYRSWALSLAAGEVVSDAWSMVAKAQLFTRGLMRLGWSAAFDQAAGLDVKGSREENGEVIEADGQQVVA